MPILEAEARMYPDNLLRDAGADGGNRNWWALMTKTRQEKSVARHLLSREIPFYLPLIWKDNFIRDPGILASRDCIPKQLTSINSFKLYV